MLRGTDEVDAEYADICDAAVSAGKVSPWQVRSVRYGGTGRAGGELGAAQSHVPGPPTALLQSWKNLVARHNLPMTVMACSLAALQRECCVCLSAGGRAACQPLRTAMQHLTLSCPCALCPPLAALPHCTAELTGINSVIFYAPIIFESLTTSSSALLNSVIIGATNVRRPAVASHPPRRRCLSACLPACAGSGACHAPIPQFQAAEKPLEAWPPC